VQLSQLSLRQFEGDSDLSLWAGTGNLQLADQKPADLGPAFNTVNTSRVNDIKTVDLTRLAGTYDWLAISARLAQNNDFAKLQTLIVQQPTSPVPEANTWALFLSGLALTAFAVRRRG
jgi:hypothetical protein